MYREGLILKDLHDLAQRSRLSFYQISVSAVDTRNAALLHLAELLEQEKAAVFSANQKDLENAKNEQLAPPLLHRLAFGEEKLR